MSALKIGIWLMTFADDVCRSDGRVEGGMILALLIFIRKATTPAVTIVREQHIEKGTRFNEVHSLSHELSEAGS